jgi:tRNA(Ile)-lysidine synthase
VTDFLQRVEKGILNRKLLVPKQRVLVAVSGGLDSMALLHTLYRLATAHRWKLFIAHLNHRLRGRSSDADERLVKKTAKQMGLKVVTESADVRSLAKQQKLSLEMAARQIRHEFLARTARRLRVSTVALAHHADDQQELFFLRLLRGSGSEGLGGMRWRGGSPVDPRIQIIRPFMNQPKAALLNFAKLEGISFREDASNASLDMQRNRVRHELLPLLKKHYQPALGRIVDRVSDITTQEADYVTAAAQRWLDHKTSTLFDELHVAVQRRCIQLQGIRLGFDVDYDLVERLRLQPGRRVSISEQGFALRTASGEVEWSSLTQSPRGQGWRARFELEHGGALGFAGVQFTWEVTSEGGATPKRQTPGQEVFDADRVGSSITLRHWKPGDRFQPIGMEQAVKLQDLFTNAKIPAAARRRLVVGVTRSGEIFWVENLRISEEFKVRPNTIRRLLWRWKPT